MALPLSPAHSEERVREGESKERPGAQHVVFWGAKPAIYMQARNTNGILSSQCSRSEPEEEVGVLCVGFGILQAI